MAHAVLTTMDTDATVNEGRAIAFESKRSRLGEILTPNGLRDLVRHQPFLAFTGAGAVGAMLGGLVFPRLGRLAFLAVAGYAANHFFQRQRALDVDEVGGSGPRRRDREAI